MESPKILPPRKDTISNQDSTIIITQKYPILPPLLEKQPNGLKTLIDDTHFSNKTKDKHNYSTDNSRTENEDAANKINVKRMKISMMNTKKIIQKLLKFMKV